MAKAKVIFQKAVMKVRVGVFIIVNFFEELFADSASTTDTVSKSLATNKSDQTSAQDQLNVATEKQLSDASDVADNAVFQTIKELSNFGDVTDLHLIVAGLSKEELPVVDEFLSFALNAVQEDSSNFTDAFKLPLTLVAFWLTAGKCLSRNF